MKIGILGTRGIPNNYGGFEQFAQWLSHGLVEKGHEVYVYNSSHHPYQEKEWNGVNIIHCKDNEYKIGTAGQFFYDLRCNRDAVKRNFDVLFHFGYSSDALWWRQWPKNTRNIVNMDGLEWKRTKYNAATRKFLKLSEAWAAKHADLLIADSPGIRDYLLKEYGKTAVYISYGAEIFSSPDENVLNSYQLKPREYSLVIARMEPENNIEMIIGGYLGTNTENPLIIIGGTKNKFGRYLQEKYSDKKIRFMGAVYDQQVLNNLRYYSGLYFHGHSVGGTNPSLLEAMACGCNIAAHENVFNKAVLEGNGRYFNSARDVKQIIESPSSSDQLIRWKMQNIEKLEKHYNPKIIIDLYESLALKFFVQRTPMGNHKDTKTQKTQSKI